MNMKLIFTCFILLAVAGALHAQPCTSADAQIDLEGNAIRARILNNGNLFTDYDFGQFLPNPLPFVQQNPSTIFAAGLWLGGINPAGFLRLNVPTYNGGYAAGPLNDDGQTTTTDCSNWDKHFLVKGSDVAAFLADLPNLAGNPAAAVAQYKSIMGWPGRDNPYFSNIWGFDLPFNTQSLAPFYDEDGDGVYNPLAGDYPVVQLRNKPPFVPEVFVWSVFNDRSVSPAFPVEVQQTAWAFNCPDRPVLNHSVFTSHKIIYRGIEKLDSCFFGMWVDFDLGCYTDDYLGSAPDQDAFFVYNQDITDGSAGATCEQGVPTFADNPPVQSVTFLSQSLDKFMVYNSPSVGSPLPGTTDPSTSLEFYRYLTGYWRDGSPLTYGGSGFQSAGGPTDYAFPSNPADPNGWTMCTASLPLADRKGLGSHKVGTLLPGQVEEMTIAWTVHLDPDLPCGVGDMYDDIAGVRSLYDGGFTGVCSPLTSLSEALNAAIGLFPNPSAGTVTVQYGDLPVREIRLFAADGRLAMALQNPQPEQSVLDLGQLDNGVYTLVLLSERGMAVKRLVVLKN